VVRVIGPSGIGSEGQSALAGDHGRAVEAAGDRGGGHQTRRLAAKRSRALSGRSATTPRRGGQML